MAIAYLSLITRERTEFIGEGLIGTIFTAVLLAVLFKRILCAQNVIPITKKFIFPNSHVFPKSILCPPNTIALITN
ncbi:hypothetical protein ACB092_11G065300 [Castanea dentata]